MEHFGAERLAQAVTGGVGRSPGTDVDMVLLPEHFAFLFRDRKLPLTYCDPTSTCTRV